MTGSVALDVVIGLVFIYLLYSLFATIIMEILNSFLGLRARNLRYTLRRMLMDEKEFTSSNNFKKKIFRLIINNFLKITGKAYNLRGPKLFNEFYGQPLIKYLGGGGLLNKPSYITAQNFSKAIMDSLKSFDKNDDASKSLLERIQIGIEKVGQNQAGSNNNSWVEKATIKTNQFFSKKLKINTSKISLTQQHLQSLLDDAGNDLEKFKTLLEQWFDDTMERSTGWFKKRVQYFLFIIGFFLAVSFNANTLDIIKKLSNDPKAREDLVAMANTYVKDNEELIKEINSLKEKAKDSTDSIAIDSVKTTFKTNIDSLKNLQKTIQTDIYKAQNVIGTNWKIPDFIEIKPIDNYKKGKQPIKKSDSIIYNIPLKVKIPGKRKKEYQKKYVSVTVHKSIDIVALTKTISPISSEKFNSKTIEVNKNKYKQKYVFMTNNFWGYFITALAISMGSPFWFDLLNKLIKLRNSVKPIQEKQDNAGDQ